MAGILLLLATSGRARFSTGGGGGLDDTGIGSAAVTIEFRSTGLALFSGANAGTLGSFNWVDPVAYAPGAYTIRLTVNSGTSPTGSAVNTDLALSSNRSWTWARNTAGETTATATLTLKDGSGTVLASDTYLVQVTAT